MRFTAQLRVRTRLEPIRRRLRDPFGGVVGRVARRRIGKVMTQEFSRGVGFGPSGAAIPWTPTLAFGRRPATSPPLGGAGSSILRALKGGPGGSVTVTGRRIRYVVDLIYAAVHRFGAVIRAKRRLPNGRLAMQVLLAGKFGVFAREEKLLAGVVIPKRPFADLRAPQYIRAARGAVVEGLDKASSR